MMRKMLARHLVEAGLDEIAGPFDLALASYSLYNVLPVDRVLQVLAERRDGHIGIYRQRQTALVWIRHQGGQHCQNRF